MNVNVSLDWMDSCRDASIFFVVQLAQEHVYIEMVLTKADSLVVPN